MNRIQTKQNEHDAVIQSAYDNLDKIKHNVYINPNQQKNVKVGDFYPDIIITTKDTDDIQFIIEVETDDSINNDEANQWLKYSKLGGTFYLLVPIDSKRKAELLCVQHSIRARFGTYKIQNNSYKITYE